MPKRAYLVQMVVELNIEDGVHYTPANCADYVAASIALDDGDKLEDIVVFQLHNNAPIQITLESEMKN